MSWFSRRKKKTKKWSVARIRERYDVAAMDFAKLPEGQPEILDLPLMLELMTQAASSLCPQASSLLDVGCGTGLCSLRMLEVLPRLDLTLNDLSEQMLGRAYQRLCSVVETQAEHSTSQAADKRIKAIPGDIREVQLGHAQYDIVTASAVLHHLREDEEWDLVFQKLFDSLRPGGSLWIIDLIRFDNKGVNDLMLERYSEYLCQLKNARYSRSLLKYIELEDSPRSLSEQISLLRKVGFTQVEILHVNTCFAAFGAIKEGLSGI